MKQLEAAAAATGVQWPDYPAGQLAVAGGWCDQWSQWGAEAASSDHD